MPTVEGCRVVWVVQRGVLRLHEADRVDHLGREMMMEEKLQIYRSVLQSYISS